MGIMGFGMTPVGRAIAKTQDDASRTSEVEQQPQTLAEYGEQAAGSFERPTAFDWLEIPAEMGLADVGPGEGFGELGAHHADVREAIGGTFQETYGIEGVGEGVLPGIAPPARPLTMQQEFERRQRGLPSAVPSEVRFPVSPIQTRDARDPSNRPAMSAIYQSMIGSLDAQARAGLEDLRTRMSPEDFRTMLSEQVFTAAVSDFGYSDPARNKDALIDETRIQTARDNRELLTTGILPQIRIGLQRQDEAGEWGLQLKAFFANPNNYEHVPDNQKTAFAYLHNKLMEADVAEGWGWVVDAATDGAGSIKTGFERGLVAAGSFAARTMAHAIMLPDYLIGDMLDNPLAAAGSFADDYARFADVLYAFANDADHQIEMMGQAGQSARTLYDPDSIDPTTVSGLTNWFKNVGQGVGSLLTFMVGGTALQTFSRGTQATRMGAVVGTGRGAKLAGWLRESAPMITFAASMEGGLYFAHDYNELIRQGVDPEVAAQTAYGHALAYGLTAGLLEKFGYDSIRKAMFPLLPGREQVIKRELSRTLIAGLGRFARTTGTASANEATTEWLQYQAETLSQGIERYNLGLMTEEEGSIWERQVASMTSNEAIVSAVVGGLIGGGASAPGGIANAFGVQAGNASSARPRQSIPSTVRFGGQKADGDYFFNSVEDLTNPEVIARFVQDPNLGAIIDAFVKAPGETTSRRQVANFIAPGVQTNAAQRHAFRQAVAKAWDQHNNSDAATAETEATGTETDPAADPAVDVDPNVDQVNQLVVNDEQGVVERVANEIALGNARDMAILVLGIDSDNVGPILRGLDTNEFEELTAALASLPDIKPEESAQIFANFVEQAQPAAEPEAAATPEAAPEVTPETEEEAEPEAAPEAAPDPLARDPREQAENERRKDERKKEVLEGTDEELQRAAIDPEEDEAQAEITLEDELVFYGSREEVFKNENLMRLPTRRLRQMLRALDLSESERKAVTQALEEKAEVIAELEFPTASPQAAPETEAAPAPETEAAAATETEAAPQTEPAPEVQDEQDQSETVDEIEEKIEDGRLDSGDRRTLAQVIAAALPSWLRLQYINFLPVNREEGAKINIEGGRTGFAFAQAAVTVAKRAGKIVEYALSINNINLQSLSVMKPTQVLQKIIITVRHEIAHGIWKALTPEQKAIWENALAKSGVVTPNMDHGNPAEEAWADVFSVADDAVEEGFRTKPPQDGGLLASLPQELIDAMNQVLESANAPTLQLAGERAPATAANPERTRQAPSTEEQARAAQNLERDQAKEEDANEKLYKELSQRMEEELQVYEEGVSFQDLADVLQETKNYDADLIQQVLSDLVSQGKAHERNGLIFAGPAPEVGGVQPPDDEPEVEPFTADNLPDRIDELDEATQEAALAAFTMGGEKLDAFLSEVNGRKRSEEMVEEAPVAEQEAHVAEEAEIDEPVVSTFRILKAGDRFDSNLTESQLADVLHKHRTGSISPHDIYLQVQEPSRRSKMRLQLTAFADTTGEYTRRPYALLQTPEGIAALPLSITEADVKNPRDALNNIFAGLVSRILNRDTEADMAQVGTVVSPEEMWRLDGVFERALQLFHTRITNRSEGGKKEYPRLTIDDIYREAVDGGKRGKTPDGADRTLQNQKLVEIVLERAMNEMVRARVAKLVAEGTKQTDRGLPSDFGPLAVLKAAREVEDAFSNVATKKTRMLGQQFSTPPQIAAFAQLLGFQGSAKFGDMLSTIVEPQYGTGSLVSLLGGADVHGGEIDPARAMASQVFRSASLGSLLLSTGNTLKGNIGLNLGSSNTHVIANPPFGKPPKNADTFVKVPIGVNKDHLPESSRSPVTFETNNVEDVVIGKALTELPDLGIGVFIIGAPGGPTLTEEARKKAYQRGIFKALYSHNVLGHYTMAGKLYKATGTTFPVDVIVVQKTDKKKRLIRPKGKVAPDLMNGELPQILDSAESIDKAMREYSENYGAKKINLQRRLERLVGGSFSSVPGRKNVRAERVSRGTGLDLGRSPTTEPGGVGTAERGADEVRVTPGGKPTDGNSNYVDPDTGTSVGESQQGTTRPATEQVREDDDAGKRESGLLQEPDGAGRSALNDDMLNDLLAGAKNRKKKKNNRRGVAIIPSEEEIQKAVKFITSAIRNGITSFRNFVKALIDKLTYDGVVENIDEELAEAFNRAWAKASLLFRKKGVGEAEMDFDTAVKLEDPNRTTAAERVNPEFVDPDEIQVVYTPVSQMSAPDSIKDQIGVAETLAPRNQRDANIRALQRIEEKVKQPLTVYVAEKLGMTLPHLAKVFHAEQIDAIAAAIYANEQGQAFTIGDQTGVGKGRFVAAMLIYARRKGLFPVFGTAKKDLYRDMLRDITSITEGMDDVPLELLPTDTSVSEVGRPVNELTGKVDPRLSEEFPRAGRKKPKSVKEHLRQLNDLVARFENTGQIVTEEGTNLLGMALTYSQISGNDGVPRQDLLNRILATGKLFFVMDEAHAAAGTDSARQNNLAEIERAEKKLEAGLAAKVPAEHMSLFTVGLTTDRRLAGAVFSSATFAKRPDALYLFMKAGLGHLDKDGQQSIVKTIETGGLPMMSAFSQMLAEGGYYMRRQKSFEGITFETNQVEVEPAQMDAFASILNDMFSFARNEDVKKMFESKGQQIKDVFAGRGVQSEAMNVNSGSDLYTNVMYNLATKFLTSLKAVQTAPIMTDAILNDNELVLVGTDQTNEAALERFIEQNEIELGQEFRFSLAELAQQTLESLRYASFENPETAEKTTVYLEDSELAAAGVLPAYQELEAKLQDPQMDVLKKLPGMPIDYILAFARQKGIKTGEVTARTYKVEMDPNDPSMVRVAKRTKAESNKNKNIDDFNNARTQLVVVNSSGSTGGSFHARKGVSERLRHLFIVQPLLDVNGFIQLLGRINRYGQTVLPKYTLLSVNTPYDQKIMAVMAKKLKSLNASATAESKSSVDFKVRDIAHLVGDIAAHEWGEANEPLMEKMGLKQFAEPSLRRAEKAGDNVKDVLNRMVILPTKQQNAIMNDLESRVDEIMDSFTKQGINPMASPIRDLQFRVISEMEILDEIGDGVFDGPVVLSQVEANVLTKPPKPPEIFEALDQAHGEQEGRKGADGNAVKLNTGGYLSEWEKDAARLGRYLLALRSLANEFKNREREAQGKIDELSKVANPSESQIIAAKDLKKAKAGFARQFARINKIINRLQGWAKKDIVGGLYNRSFPIYRGKQEELAGTGVIVDLKVQTTDPSDPLFLSSKNVQITVAGDEIGIGTFSGTAFQPDGDTVTNEVDLYAGPAFEISSTEFAEAVGKDMTGRRELLFLIRGQLVRAMSEIDSEDVKAGRVVFATTIEGNTERVISVPDALPGDFGSGKLAIPPRNAAKHLNDRTYTEFKAMLPNSKSPVAVTSATEEEVLVEIKTGKRIDPLLEIAQENNLTIDSPSAGRTVIRIPNSKSKIIADVLSIVNTHFKSRLRVKDADAFDKAVGKEGELVASDGVIIDPKLSNAFAKKMNRIRKRRQNRNRRGFVRLPRPRVPKNMTIRKGDPSGRFAHFIQPGLFMEKIIFRGNGLYARSLQRLRDAYDNYTKEIDVNLKRDSKRWQKMPKDWRRDKNNRFMFIMDHPLEPWVVDKPKLSAATQRALGWGADKKKAYKMLMEAPDSVKDAFKYFRNRDEYMRKEMVRAIQKQKIAVFSQFTPAEMVSAANEEGRAWELIDDEIYDQNGKLLSPGMAAKQLAVMAVPTAGFGYRYAHVFHAWTGNFMVNKVMEDGSLKPIEGDYNLEASFKTEAQAVRAGRDWLKANPKDKLEITPVISYPGDVARLTEAQVNDIKRHIKNYTKASAAEVSAALRGKIGKLKYRQKFYAPFMKREGKGGYTKNYIEVWQSSVVGFERWRELTAANRTVQEDIEAMRGSTPGAARELQSTLDFLWNGRQAMVGVTEVMNKALDKTLNVLTGGRVEPKMADRAMDYARAANYFVNLAWPGNVAGAAVNATQIPAVTASMIGYVASTRAAAQSLANPKRSAQILEQYGRFTGRGKWDDGTLPIVSGARKVMSAINDAAFFTLVEKFNQNAAFLIGFYHYTNIGYSEQAAAAAANRLRLLTQMTYNAAEVPKIYRSKLGMTIFQYRRFSLSWLALLAGSTRDAVSGQGPLLAPVRMMLGVLVFGGLNAVIPRTVQGALARYAGYKTFSGLMTGGIGTLAAMLGYGGDEDDETVERLSNMLTYGITAGIANGEFGLSERFSPYPIRAPYQYDGAMDAFGQVIGDVVLGPTGSSVVKTYDAAMRDRSTLPLPERVANMTTMTRQLYQLDKVLRGDMARRSGMGNRNYTQSALAQWSRVLGFEDTAWMKQSGFIQSLNAATEMNAEMVNDVAKAFLQAVDFIAENRFEEGNAKLKEGVDLLVRYNQEPGFEITAEMVRRRIDNMKESRNVGLLIRRLKDANDTVARNWFLSMPPSEQKLFAESLTDEAIGIGR